MRAVYRVLSEIFALVFVVNCIFTPVCVNAYDDLEYSEEAYQDSGATYGYSRAPVFSNATYVTMKRGTAKILQMPETFDGEVSWSSGNTTVATVSSIGRVQARRAGNAIITADVWKSDGTHSIVYYEVYVFDILLEAQHKSNWCWAASARMASRARKSSSISQESAAVYVKLGIETNSPSTNEILNSNLPATVAESENAVEYIIGLNNVYSCWGRTYSEATLRQLLDNNNVIIALRGWYNDNGQRYGGHFTVIYDYYWDSIRGKYRYRIMDPWPVNEGATYSRDYQTICNGRNSAVGDEADAGIWEGIVVYELDNYYNTISWLSY